MWTEYHRFLCPQSHLYYNHHCIVKRTVSIVVVYWDETFAFSTSHFKCISSSFRLSLPYVFRAWNMIQCISWFLHVSLIPHLNNPSSFRNDPCQPFYSYFYPDKIRLKLIRKLCVDSISMPTVFENVCLLSGGVGPQPSHRGPQWLFIPAGDLQRAGAAARCSSWSHCLHFIVAYFALRMHLHFLRTILKWWNL